MANDKEQVQVDLRQQKLNRSQRRELTRRLWSADPGLTTVHPNAAGVDVGNSEHYAAVPPDRDQQAVRSFPCFTENLRQLVEWLKRCGITSVALQSTGVYWIPLYDMLEAEGFEVYLVNAQHTKNLPGRKSDVQESQWLMKLHTYGLLNNSFRPVSEIRRLRCYWRHRAEHVQAASTSIQRMQKASTEMNLQLHNVISDLSGVTGMRILRAIVNGERDRNKLAAMRDRRVRASEEEIAKSLEGNWHPELLFVLQQELDTYDMYQRKLTECDVEIQKQMAAMATRPQAPLEGTLPETSTPSPKKDNKDAKKDATKKRRGNAPAFDLRSELERITGTDLTRIEGVDVMTAQTVISEIGLDMSRWRTEGHFSSWLGLSPSHDISGGKVLKRGTRKVVNRAATALRMAASTLIKSKSYLGAQYRRFRSRLGAPKAITAMAHKLARLIYRMLKFGENYVAKSEAHYEAKYRESQIRFLTKKAKELGLQLAEITTTP
jgi:transposase